MRSDPRVRLRRPHKKQAEFINSKAKRKVVRAGRRSGKTVGIAVYAVKKFLEGHRVLYATPTLDQVDRFWFEITEALMDPIARGVFYKNETKRLIELPHTENRIRAKTAWNADTLRGDYADELILDEYQLMSEDAWAVVGAPMLLDNNGNATFIYTPPSLHTQSASKAKDKMHAAKLFAAANAKRAAGDKRWETFHFTSHDNPYLSIDGLSDITKDMTAWAYRMEIMAEDLDQIPGALWTRGLLEDCRVSPEHIPPLKVAYCAIDPAVTAHETSDETGIVIGGVGEDGHGYITSDLSGTYTPDAWARRAVNATLDEELNGIVAEVNNGGDLVKNTIRHVEADDGAKIGQRVRVLEVRATKGKYTRAEPVASLYEQHRIHHVGSFAALEDQLCTWVPGEKSPDRLDALVWLMTKLMIEGAGNRVLFEA